MFGILSLYRGGLVVCLEGLLVHGGVFDLGGDALLGDWRVAIGVVGDVIGHTDRCRLLGQPKRIRMGKVRVDNERDGEAARNGRRPRLRPFYK